MTIKLSPLPHAWLIDLDGTVLRHNGHLTDTEELLPGTQEFWASIPSNDHIILLTARHEDFRGHTVSFLKSKGLRFNFIHFGMPKGERVLVNDMKPSGLQTALAINVIRDEGLSDLTFTIDDSL